MVLRILRPSTYRSQSPSSRTRPLGPIQKKRPASTTPCTTLACKGLGKGSLKRRSGGICCCTERSLLAPTRCSNGEPPSPPSSKTALTTARNHKLLSKLPTGFTLTATTQVAGRGRGANVWVAPAGSLLFSAVINHPAHLAATRPIVFIQYLAAIATVEAIQSYDVGPYAKLPVKLKWPNDIYARDPTKPTETAYVKIGGILANCAYSAGNYQIVLGIGVNTNNGRPTTSLDALLPFVSGGKDLPPFQIERLLARMLTRLEALYAEFLRAGFSRDLEGRYYRHWLHSDQVVTLEAEGGARARVLGITTDWGMLKAEELKADGINGALRPTGKVWALQSDENSFDFWRGLVRRKV